MLDGARRCILMYEGIGLLVTELTRSTLKFTQRKLGERILVEKRMGGRVYLSLIMGAGAGLDPR